VNPGVYGGGVVYRWVGEYKSWLRERAVVGRLEFAHTSHTDHWIRKARGGVRVSRELLDRTYLRHLPTCSYQRSREWCQLRANRCRSCMVVWVRVGEVANNGAICKPFVQCLDGRH
jgi:hypothetical protein